MTRSTLKTNRRKWRNYLIKPSFQLRLILIQLIFPVALSLVFIISLLYPFYNDILVLGTPWTQYMAAQIWLQLLERFGVVMILIVVIASVYQILFSHRLCGPLVNMTHTFTALSKGDVTRKVCLRQRDFLKDEARVINAMLGAIEQRIGQLKTSQAQLHSLARQLPQGSVEQHLRQALAHHQQLLDQWVVTSGPFMTPAGPDDPAAAPNTIQT